MKIPNYDGTPNSNNKYKQLHSFMPDSCFRMLICGNSGSGKTNVLIHMLRAPLIYYDKLYLYSKNLEQKKYQDFIKLLEKTARKIKVPLDDILEVSNDDIIDLDEIEVHEDSRALPECSPLGSSVNESQKVVIFDDYICERNQNDIIKYFIGGRHKNCCVIYLSQSYYKTPKDIRLNCSHYILFESPNKSENDMIAREQNIPKTAFQTAIKKQYDFLYLDKPKKTVTRNFDENIYI